MKPGFEHIELWIFDMDNTLYAPDPEVSRQIGGRMRRFIADLLELPEDEAHKIQKECLHEYGLTATGLEKRYGVDAAAFMNHVHDVDYSVLRAAEGLREAIEALPGRKVVHTNNIADHSRALLRHLGLEDAFDALYDIAFAGYVAKPARASFEKVLAAEATPPARAAMIEDAAHNLKAPHAMGMTTLWIANECDWARAAAHEAHIHHHVDDLTAFLRDIAR